MTLIAGDIHGSLKHLRYLCAVAEANERSVILSVGDCGFIWRDDDMLDRATDILAEFNLQLWWLDGNHENFDLMKTKYGITPDDVLPTWLNKRVRYLPRGCRFDIDGVRYMAFGGAPSVDQHDRMAHRDWWPDEEITQEQVDRVLAENSRVDVLVTHDAPSGTKTLDRHLERNGFQLSMDLIFKTERSRDLIREVVDHVRPTVVVHGHYHYAYNDGDVIGLACNDGGRGSWALTRWTVS